MVRQEEDTRLCWHTENARDRPSPKEAPSRSRFVIMSTTAAAVEINMKAGVSEMQRSKASASWPNADEFRETTTRWIRLCYFFVATTLRLCLAPRRELVLGRSFYRSPVLPGSRNSPRSCHFDSPWMGSDCGRKTYRSSGAVG